MASELIGSDKVEGTNVYGSDRQKIGFIERIMIEKRSGKVDYAVLSFGGFLGMGDQHFPLPWSSLNYDEDLDGYQVSVTEDQLRDAPKYLDENGWDWEDAAGGRQSMTTTDSRGTIDSRPLRWNLEHHP